jgi:hypothetical protein
MTRLCKDCKFYKKYHGYGGSGGTYDECLCPDLKKEISPINGQERMNFCYFERIYQDRCGDEARYFQPKDGTEVPEKPKNFWNWLFGV